MLEHQLSPVTCRTDLAQGRQHHPHADHVSSLLSPSGLLQKALAPLAAPLKMHALSVDLMLPLAGHNASLLGHAQDL